MNKGMLSLYDDHNHLVDTFIPDISPRANNWLTNLPDNYSLEYDDIYNADYIPGKLIARGINGVTVYTELGIKILSEHNIELEIIK